MYQKVKIGNLVRLRVWNNPGESDIMYGIVTRVEKGVWDYSDNYYVMTCLGVCLYSWDEIDELICE